MLNKSQSKKINQLKSLLLIPVIAGFLMSFNTKEVFIENGTPSESLRSIQQIMLDSNEVQIEFNKYLTNAELESIKQQLKQKGIDFSYTKLQRNVNGEISSIHAKFKTKTGSTTWNDKNENGIGDFYFFKSEESFGVSRLNTRNPIYILDGKEISEEKLNKINPKNIVSVTVFKDEKAIEKYGDKGKNGVIEITSKTNQNDIEMDSGNPINSAIIKNNGQKTIFKGNAFLTLKDNEDVLVYVNGKEQSMKKAKSIAPEKIESITVLKGKTSIKKYGDKGKNGVIEITLK